MTKTSLPPAGCAATCAAAAWETAPWAAAAWVGAAVWAAAALAFPVVASATSSPGEEAVIYTGTATSLKNREFLYGETHVVISREGQAVEGVVLYTCRDGSPFARKAVSYLNAMVPNFQLEDASNGMREGVRTEGDGREVFFRGARGEAEKNGSLPQVPDLVVDAGFDEFVRANWQPLLSGKALSMHFLIPSRLGDMGFRVLHQGSELASGVPVEVFRLKLSGVLGWVLPGIDVYYGAADHVLMRYVGLSDLRDASQDNLPVDISFHPDDRRPAAVRDVEEARRARLVPCR